MITFRPLWPATVAGCSYQHNWPAKAAQIISFADGPISPMMGKAISLYDGKPQQLAAKSESLKSNTQSLNSSCDFLSFSWLGKRRVRNFKWNHQGVDRRLNGDRADEIGRVWLASERAAFSSSFSAIGER